MSTLALKIGESKTLGDLTDAIDWIKKNDPEVSVLVKALLDVAEDIVLVYDQAVGLASTAKNIQVKIGLLLHFAEKFGIDNINTFKTSLSYLTQPSQECINAQKRLLEIGDNLLVMPAVPDKKNLEKLAELFGPILDEAVSPKIELLTHEVVDAVMPYVKCLGDLPDFMRNHQSSITFAANLTAEYVLGCKDIDLSDAHMILHDFSNDHFFASAALVVWDKIAPKLKPGHHSRFSLDTLKYLATCIRDPFGDGRYSKYPEDIIIGAGLSLPLSAKGAANLATAFATRSGTHRWLIAYIGEKQPKTEDEANTLAVSVKGRAFFGEDVFALLHKAGEEHGYAFTEPENSNPSGKIKGFLLIGSDGAKIITLPEISGFDSDGRMEAPDSLSRMFKLGGQNPALFSERLMRRQGPTKYSRTKVGCACISCLVKKAMETNPELSALSEELERFCQHMSQKNLVKTMEDGHVFMIAEKIQELVFEAYEADFSDDMVNILRMHYNMQNPKSESECNCIVCQIERAISQDPDKYNGLCVEYNGFIAWLEKNHKGSVQGETLILNAPVEEVIMSAKENGFSDEFLEILKKSFEQANRKQNDFLIQLLSGLGIKP